MTALPCGCSFAHAVVWRDFSGKTIIGCPKHPPPEPPKPDDLIAMEKQGQILATQPWTSEQTDAFLQEHPTGYNKVTGLRAIAYIWAVGGALVAYYIRSSDSFGRRKDGWIYKL
jgi:hypothetical protein